MGASHAMSRRSVAATLGALAAAPPAWAAGADPLSGERLYADVRRYASFGVHRTGTPGDAATADWMVRELTGAGFRAERQAFDYPVFDLKRAELAVGGRKLQGQPLWTPRTTPAGGLKGPLSVEGRAGAILVVSLPYNPGSSLEVPAYRDALTKAASSGAAGVVAITENPVGELIMLNADPNAAPWPAPVLLVAGREGPALLEAAKAGAAATLRLEGSTAVRPAYNVLGRRARAGKPVVISTPKSGWLTCAGERGSGVAIWLGLARWAAANTDLNLILAATSGHEFHGYGGHFAAKVTPKPGETRLWIHIGANVAAYDFARREGRLVRLAAPQRGRGVASTHDILPVVEAAFAGQVGYGTPTDIDVQRAPGEVALYHRLGYRPIVGLVGGHPLHHTPRDLPDVTGPEILEPVARGLQSVLRSL